MRRKSLTYRDVLFQEVAVLDRQMNKMESGRQVKGLPRISVAKPGKTQPHTASAIKEPQHAD